MDFGQKNTRMMQTLVSSAVFLFSFSEPVYAFICLLMAIMLLANIAAVNISYERKRLYLKCRH